MLPCICGHSKHEANPANCPMCSGVVSVGCSRKHTGRGGDYGQAYGCRSSVMARRGTRLTLIFFCRTWARS